MKNVFSKIKTAAALCVLVALAACDNDATVASRNLSQAADNFEINRRIVFYNGITDNYVLTIEGRCSLEVGNPVRVTCKTGPGAYKKHHLGVSHNVTWFAEQLESANVSAYHYRVTFKPQVIIPDIDFRGSASEVPVVGSPSRPAR